ncbi:cyclin [Aspergillus avenaceus]|uniref:Cyclin n=1 Tax=Aspergillus avenaceus TaxID=36643 RepID=A0A5N6TH50_ASPAV|nr:cyclin [Aspergillus avenaceus]
MDSYLRCNTLGCRLPLKEEAVVTTCSHIFCLQCAHQLGLSHSSDSRRHCPACQTILINPDDAVRTVLNPTEDYKTSVLSGLDPNTIMECAGRALMFWTYQTTQEIFYQEFLAKKLTEKYTNLNTQMDKVIHNANTEISTLQARLTEMQSSHEQLGKKNQELVDLYREKCKKFAQITNLYNILKSRAMRPHLQTAASDSVAQALNSLGTSNNTPKGPVLQLQTASGRPQHTFPVNQAGVEQLHRYQRSGTGSSKGTRKRADTSTMPPPTFPGNVKSRQMPPTPQHRTRLTCPPSRPSTGMSNLPQDSIMHDRFQANPGPVNPPVNSYSSLGRENPNLPTRGETGSGPPVSRTFFDRTII